MKVAAELPNDIAKRLEGKWGDLSQAAREAIAIEGYRSGALSQNQVQRLLGLRAWAVFGPRDRGPRIARAIVS